MDEIDVEERRLDFLKEQSLRRIGEIIAENEGLESKAKHVQTKPAVTGKPRAVKGSELSTGG